MDKQSITPVMLRNFMSKLTPAQLEELHSSSTSESENSESSQNELPSQEVPSDIEESQDLPPWIVRGTFNERFKGYYFDPAHFEPKKAISFAIREWCEKDIVTCDWGMYLKNTSQLVGEVTTLVKSFYQHSVDKRAMHSSERHDLAACVSIAFPLLAKKYTEFKHRSDRGIPLGSSVSKSTFDGPTFSMFFFEKLTKRLENSFGKRNDDEYIKLNVRNKLRIKYSRNSTITEE